MNMEPEPQRMDVEPDPIEDVRKGARALLNARMGAFGDEVRGEKLAPEFIRILERIARR